MLTTSEVAELLGVATTSVKRWADQGLLPCVRTAGKHRRFHRADIDKFALQTHGIAPPRGNDLLTLLRSPKAVSDEAWIALLTGDKGPYGIRAALLAERELGGSWWQVSERLQSVFMEIGQRWHNNELLLVEEHIASEQLIRALVYVSEQILVAQDAPKCLLATAEHEEHTLGLTLCELCLREAGWKTQWVGSNTPTYEIIKFIYEHPPSMLALSASVNASAQTLADQAKALAKVCRQLGTRLLFGGQGPWPEQLPNAHRIYSFRQLHELLSQLRLHATSVND